ncbi:MAG: class I SAM-dependent methyltransferase [Candidatus Hydrogenedens sp.]
MGFNRIAKFYPLLFDEKARLTREGPLLLEILKQYRRPVHVLDLACGLGVHSRFFAEQGADVIGVDVSPDMLKYAKKQSQSESIHYIVGNIVKLPLIGHWDFILCLGNSLCLLPDRKHVYDFFAQIKNLLSSHGTFILQILNYSHPDIKEIQTKCMQKEIDGKKVTIIKTLTPDNDVVFLSINYFAQVQGKYELFSESNILLKLSLSELLNYSNEVGLSVLSTYGDFQKSTFNSTTSKDVIIIFSRKFY